jgi:hypothetical protein
MDDIEAFMLASATTGTAKATNKVGRGNGANSSLEEAADIFRQDSRKTVGLFSSLAACRLSISLGLGCIF